MKTKEEDIEHLKCNNCGTEIIPEMEFMECQNCRSWDKTTTTVKPKKNDFKTNTKKRVLRPHSIRGKEGGIQGDKAALV